MVNGAVIKSILSLQRCMFYDLKVHCSLREYIVFSTEKTYHATLVNLRRLFYCANNGDMIKFNLKNHNFSI